MHFRFNVQLRVIVRPGDVVVAFASRGVALIRAHWLALADARRHGPARPRCCPSVAARSAICGRQHARPTRLANAGRSCAVRESANATDAECPSPSTRSASAPTTDRGTPRIAPHVADALIGCLRRASNRRRAARSSHFGARCARGDRRLAVRAQTGECAERQYASCGCCRFTRRGDIPRRHSRRRRTGDDARRCRSSPDEGSGNDFVVHRRHRATQIELAADADSARSPTGISAWAATRPARRRSAGACRRRLSATGSSTPTAARSSNAATVRAASCSFVRDRGLDRETPIRSRRQGGIIEPRLEDDGQVTVDMGDPAFRARGDSFCWTAAAPSFSRSRSTARPCSVIGRCRWAIRTRSRSWTTSTTRRSRRRAAHRAPLRDFRAGSTRATCRVVDRANIRLRVWERARARRWRAAPAPACRGGRHPAPGCSIRQCGVDNAWRRAGRSRGGGDGAGMSMTGPAATVFEGEWR